MLDIWTLLGYIKVYNKTQYRAQSRNKTITKIVIRIVISVHRKSARNAYVTSDFLNFLVRAKEIQYWDGFLSLESIFSLLV